jgi:hypothetical protein
MNQSPDDLQRRLEQATAPDCPAEALADAELAAWREGWLALGRMLDDRDQRSGPVAILHPSRLGPQSPSPGTPRKVSVVSVLIAASLLLAATLFGLYRAKKLFPELDPTHQQLVQDSTQRSLRGIDLRWDDNWDARISVLSTRLALVQCDGDGWTTEYFQLSNRANALQWELENSSL